MGDTPDWEYSPGSYEYTSWIVGGIVLSDGQNLASTGDMFAAFDEAGNVRGVANQVDGFGPTEGQMLYEMTIGGNTDGDQIHFQYYDVSENAILSIAETYAFLTNEQQGSLVEPLLYNIDLGCLEPFCYNSSTQQAFYFFTEVQINGSAITLDDWVGAFNGDVCVGATQWDTSQCNGGTCSAPVMGYDINIEGTEGYMIPGDVPTFKIYDASENAYFDAMASENIPWGNFGFNMLDLLSSTVSILGCMDDGSLNDSPYPGIAACNYDNLATEDDGFCEYPEWPYDCDGSCTVIEDCAGVCGGSLEVDECDVCGGDGSSCQVANSAPVIDAISDPSSILEDAGAQTINLSGIGDGDAGATQALTVTATSNNTSLIPNPTVTYTSDNTTGSLAYTPVSNANGSAVITVTVTDDGGTANSGVNSTTRTFTINVTAVNDEPSFTKGSDKTVLEDSGTSTTTGWATSISTGPSNESGQTPTFSVTNNNNSLFSGQPAISSSGVLTFTPASNANGSATVTISLSDDGGTSNSGDDTYANLTFTITITAVNDIPVIDAISDPSAILEDAGSQTINLSGIEDGDAEIAATQALTVTATSNNTSLIPNPTVTYTSDNTTGSLAYTPVSNANGSAVITVTVTDDGGIANGGVDTFSTTFTVSVTAVNDDIYGCTDPGSCNYNPYANVDDSSCNDECIICYDLSSDTYNYTATTEAECEAIDSGNYIWYSQDTNECATLMSSTISTTGNSITDPGSYTAGENNVSIIWSISSSDIGNGIKIDLYHENSLINNVVAIAPNNSSYNSYDIPSTLPTSTCYHFVITQFNNISNYMVGDYFTISNSSNPCGDAVCDSGESSSCSVDCGDDGGGIEHGLAFQEGFNLISFYAIPEDNSVGSVLSSMGDNAVSLLGEGVAAINTEIGWLGMLTSISYDDGYWLYVNAADTLNFIGIAIPPDQSYALHTAHNLISYPFLECGNISEVLPDDIEDCITAILGEGMAAINTDNGWLGGLQSLCPNDGYWFANQCDDITFTYNEPTGLARMHIQNPSPYPYNQSSLQAFYFIESIENIEIGDWIIAYHGDVVIGARQWIGEIMDVPAMGNDGYDHTKGYIEPGNTPQFKLLRGRELFDLAGDVPVWYPNQPFMVTSLAEAISVPKLFSLDMAYPNPFNPITKLRFSLPIDSHVSLTVYNLQGKAIISLVNQNMDAGYHSIAWNADSHSSGVYFVKMVSGEYTNTQKLILVK